MAFYRRVPPNLVGRDFIIGDLHWCLAQLLELLMAVNFDFQKDRLFAVGDLIDRGPNSLEALMLIRQPWFFYVLGNHEAMLLTFLGLQGSGFHTASDFLNNGGDWVLHLSEADRTRLVHELAPLLMEAPVLITVDDPVSPFHVTHADLLHRSGLRMLRDEDLDEDQVKAHYTHFTWSRRLKRPARNDIHPASPVIDGVYVGMQHREPGLSLTYVGHNIMRYPVLHRSHVFIDRGAYENLSTSELFMVEHRRFAAKLKAEGWLP
jgi:serine/threonine protein phosphatase 1